MPDWIAVLLPDVWWVQLSVPIWLVCFGYFAIKLKSEQGRLNIRRLLDPERIGTKSLNSHYQRLLETCLDWIDQRLPASPAERSPGWRTAWSGALLDKALLFAIAYPILSLVIVWWITGQTGFLGTLPILEAEPDLAWRWLVAMIVLSPWIALATTRNMRVVFSIYFVAVAGTAGAGAAAAAALTLAFAVAFVGAVAAAVAGAGTFAGTFAGAYAYGFVFAGTSAIAGAGAGADASAGAGAIAIASAVAGTGAVYFCFKALRARYQTQLSAWAFLFVSLFAALLFAARFSDPNGRGSELLIFCGALPLLNALFDFLSIGITRYALRKSGEEKTFFARLKWSVIDAGAAILCLLALVLSLLIAIRALNAAAPSPIVDLGAIFAAIREDGHSYWWLYLTLFSTLIPTFLHFVLCIYSFAVSRLTSLDKVLAGILNRYDEVETSSNDKDGSHLYVLGIALPIIFTISCALPIIASGFVGIWVVEYHQDWGFWILDRFEQFAIFVGTILPPAETMDI